MKPSEHTKGDIARDRLRALVEFHGYTLFMARVLLERVDDELCEKLIDDIDNDRV
jgi:hypothetical protein